MLPQAVQLSHLFPGNMDVQQGMPVTDHVTKSSIAAWQCLGGRAKDIKISQELQMKQQGSDHSQMLPSTARWCSQVHRSMMDVISR